jgi:GTPase KRas protein
LLLFSILGNKCDLENEREVTSQEGKDLSKSLGCPFLETSAKARINVEEAFYEVVREIRKWNAQSSGDAGGGSSGDNKDGKTKKRRCMIL